MEPDQPPSAREIGKIVPACPRCGSTNYHSLVENAPQSFRLKALRCEACEFDILSAYWRLEKGRLESRSGLGVSAGLTCIILMELLTIALQLLE